MTRKDELHDWRVTALQRFCNAHGVEILVDDEWQTKQRRFRMRRPNGRETVDRFVSYEALETLLPTVLARGMLNELEKMEGKK